MIGYEKQEKKKISSEGLIKEGRRGGGKSILIRSGGSVSPYRDTI